MNLLSTIGSFTIAAGFLVFLYNVLKTRNNVITDPDPWDARSLEWGTSSPPPVWNYDEDPTVNHLDEWWHRKYTEDDRGRPVRRESFEYLADPHNPPKGVHLPSPSYWPIIVAFGLPFIGYGLIYTYWLAGVGGAMVVFGAFGWALEPSVDPNAGHGHDDDHPDALPSEPSPALVASGSPVEEETA
jgi:cytochrome c oxidase subunit 1